MGKLDRRSFDLGRTDRLAAQETPIHRLDPRAKLLVTLLFAVTVVSFNKYALAAMAPLAIYPLVLLVRGRIPAGYLLKKVLVVSPFAILVGVANPLLDREVLLNVFGIHVAGGWVSFGSILLRFLLTVSAALLLVAVSGFHRLCAGMARLGVPQVLVVQFLFLYRYLFVLMAEGQRLVRARSLRAVGGAGQSFSSYGPMVGHLALRTLTRAQRIYQAMCCRGFDGQFHGEVHGRWGLKETLFLLAWALYFGLVRWHNLPQLLGQLILGGSS
jgi:cobalt/nickel transport system permease protein